MAKKNRKTKEYMEKLIKKEGTGFKCS